MKYTEHGTGGCQVMTDVFCASNQADVCYKHQILRTIKSTWISGQLVITINECQYLTIK